MGTGGVRMPTSMLALTGTLAHNKGRYANRADEPDGSQPFPTDPPDHLTDHQKQCWRELVDLAHPGTLCRSDAILMEHGAMILAELRARRWVVGPQLLLRLEVFLSKMGMTPADRSRIRAPKRKNGPDPLDEFKRGTNKAA